MIERARQYHAYEVYRDLGYGRTFRAVAREVEASPSIISKWAKLFGWDERITQHNTSVTKKKEMGALLKVDDPIAHKLVDAMERVEAIIDGAFIQESTGNLIPQIKVTSVEELTKLISEYRKFLETYHKFVAEHMPRDKNEKKMTHINQFNQYIGDVSQEERIAIMERLKNGDATGGDKQSEGRIQDADFEQVPERGDEDGLGREGVLGSTTGGSSGDKGTVRES